MRLTFFTRERTGPDWCCAVGEIMYKRFGHGVRLLHRLRFLFNRGNWQTITSGSAAVAGVGFGPFGRRTGCQFPSLHNRFVIERPGWHGFYFRLRVCDVSATVGRAKNVLRWCNWSARFRDATVLWEACRTKILTRVAKCWKMIIGQFVVCV